MEMFILNGGVDVIREAHADRAATGGPKRTGAGM